MSTFDPSRSCRGLIRSSKGAWATRIRLFGDPYFPREADDEFSKTGLSGLGLNSLVRERLGAAIAVPHLKTSRGPNDYAHAEAAYRDLARQSNQSSL